MIEAQDAQLQVVLFQSKYSRKLDTDGQNHIDNAFAGQEQGARDLGYAYKRKRDNTLSIHAIPSTVAAEAVFAVWRERPHLAKYRRNEFGSIGRIASILWRI